MLQVMLTVVDESGRRVDPDELGVDGVVAALRARPPAGAAPPGVDDLDVLVIGPAMLSMESIERASRQVSALRSACVVAIAEDAGCADGPDRAVDEVSCALLVSRRSARRTHDTAQELRTQPEVWAALHRGEVDLTRATILCQALLEIPRWDPDGTERAGWSDQRAALRRDGLAYAREHTARRLELFLRRRLAALGCADRDRARRRALDQRGVWLNHRGDGTADLVAQLASADAERVYAAIRACALADRNGDPRHEGSTPREPLDLWMAAALVDLVLGPAGPHPCPSDPTAVTPAQPTRRVHVDTTITVTIPIDSLAGLSDHPGTIDGFGIIPADQARQLAAADARWRHILTCRTTGAMLDVGTLSHRPPATLDRHVRLRDGTCRFPGCQVPARECDLDHLIPFPTGPTSESNLHALCRRHHRLKHEGGWTVEALPGNALRWTSPQGARATSHPDDTHHDAA